MSGSLENRMMALEKGVWGVGERAKGLWNKVEPGDKVVFYATRTGVIGYGVVEGLEVEGKLIYDHPPENDRGTSVLTEHFQVRKT